ncbi:phage tail tube protein [Escherichia coli]|uniref:phage tail tube protein n=1 Tax=Escherichia coli TaxID=562 RepID=UPI000BB5B1B7|nr:phage tail tube protein [Escherichia coli]EFH2659430.1 phage tail protein [Escherichia coli]EJA1204684.1 phage tail tube protein [Escherichia coli]EJM9650481.1 phage tail tube protein [Escherichia coli]ELI1906976.1 phage tail tube protein [Escherichia coli]MBB9897689.1 phage tail tube protein [Escherichia coli]
MMSKNALAGTCTVTIDGVSVNVAGTFRYSVGEIERETLTGMSGIHGFKESYKAPFIEMTVRDSGSLSLKDFAAYTDVTVAAYLVNGKTILGQNMWLTGRIETDNNDATFTARFEGREVTES